MSLLDVKRPQTILGTSHCWMSSGRKLSWEHVIAGSQAAANCPENISLLDIKRPQTILGTSHCRMSSGRKLSWEHVLAGCQAAANYPENMSLLDAKRRQTILRTCPCWLSSGHFPTHPLAKGEDVLIHLSVIPATSVPVMALNLNTSIIVSITESDYWHLEPLPLWIQCILYIFCFIGDCVSGKVSCKMNSCYGNGLSIKHTVPRYQTVNKPNQTIEIVLTVTYQTKIFWLIKLWKLFNCFFTTF